MPYAHSTHTHTHSHAIHTDQRSIERVTRRHQIRLGYVWLRVRDANTPRHRMRAGWCGWLRARTRNPPPVPWAKTKPRTVASLGAVVSEPPNRADRLDRPACVQLLVCFTNVRAPGKIELGITATIARRVRECCIAVGLCVEVCVYARACYSLSGFCVSKVKISRCHWEAIYDRLVYTIDVTWTVRARGLMIETDKIS